MPQFNAHGDYEAGIGGGDEVHGYVALVVNGSVCDPGPGGGGDWLTDQEVACYRYTPMPFRAVAIDKTTSAHRVLRTSQLGFNGVHAGGGRWATTETQTGHVVMDDGTEVPYPLIALGQRDGVIAMRAHPYNGSGLIVGGKVLVPAASDEDVVRFGTNCWDVQVLDSSHVVWRERDGAHAIGLPAPQLLPGGSYGLRVAFDGARWWVFYLAAEKNGCMVLHPVDSYMGYVLTAPGALAYRADVTMSEGVLWTVWAVNESEQANMLVAPVITPGYPLVDLLTWSPNPVPPDPVEPNPPIVTITSYAPTSGPVPLRVTAVYATEPDSGPITELHWQARVFGQTEWGDAAVNPPEDPDHTYTFSDPAMYELRLLARGPGGEGSTSALRLVTATVPEPEPIPPEPEPPEPPPVGGDMLAAYGDKPMKGFLPGVEHDNGNGTISVQKPNGKWLCITPEGEVQERDDPGGPWESFLKGRGCLIAQRDGESKGPLVYVLTAAETDE